MTANIETAKILAGLRIDPDSHPSTWLHLDGTPITDDEVTAVMSATVEDLQAAVALSYAHAEAEQTRAKMTRELADLVGGYFRRYPDRKTTGEIVPLMTAADREKFVTLAGILDRP